MSRTPREREAERTAIKAAADRLLAGTPLRSASRKLTTSELITETGLRRDVIYADYRDLVEEFQAKVKVQDSTPVAMQEVVAENTNLKQTLTQVTAELAEERAAGTTLRRVAAELSLELQQAKDELVACSAVTPLRPAARSAGASPF